MDKKALLKLSYGVYVIGSGHDGRSNAQAANTVFQVSSEPPRMVISINKNNYTHELISKSKRFSVSVLRKDTPLQFIIALGFSSGRDHDKLKDVRHEIHDAVPVVIDNAAAFLTAEVVGSVDVETHTIFIGKVVSAEVLTDGETMSYAYYREIKSGVTPAAAPTYN